MNIKSYFSKDLSFQTIHLNSIILHNFKFIVLLLIPGLLISTTGCKNYAISKAENPKCLSYVTGVFHFPFTWKGKFPAIIYKKAGYYNTLYGKIVERQKEGILFDPLPDRVSKYPKRVYKFSEITCFINDMGVIEFGALPDIWLPKIAIDLFLVPVNKPSEKETILKLESEKAFAYCLNPDLYRIKKIEYYKTNQDYSDFSQNLPYLTLNVEKDKENYIGDIYIDTPIQGETATNLDFKPGRRPSDASTQAMFGLIGTAIHEAQKSNEDIIHTFIVRDELKKRDSANITIIKFK